MRTYDGQPVLYASYKLDGHWLKIERDRYGALRAYTSHPHDITDQVRDLVFTQGMVSYVPPRTTMLGEMWVPGRPASYVKTAIKEGDEQLRWSCFDVAGLGFEEASRTCMKWGVPFVPWERVEEDLPLLPLPLHLGYRVEGWVLVDAAGERYKWKPVKTMDVVVTDVQDGRGKYIGLLGALVCHVLAPDGQPWVVAKVSGMTDAERIEFSDDPPIGRVVEVAYQCVGSGGRLRHPRFIRVRDDKAPERCTAGQDPDLEAYLATRRK